jgi:hypothetical protein
MSTQSNEGTKCDVTEDDVVKAHRVTLDEPQYSRKKQKQEQLCYTSQHFPVATLTFSVLSQGTLSSVLLFLNVSFNMAVCLGHTHGGLQPPPQTPQNRN